jgi:hypothetical protein
MDPDRRHSGKFTRKEMRMTHKFRQLLDNEGDEYDDLVDLVRRLDQSDDSEREDAGEDTDEELAHRDRKKKPAMRPLIRAGFATTRR